jgi:cytochrome c-type biogenesis protein CcmH
VKAWLRSPAFRRGSWFLIIALLLVSVVRATVDDGPPRSEEERARAIALTLKCPTCSGQSVAGSESAAARAIRAEIADRVADGQSADAIRAAIADAYGDDVQLTPGGSGAEGLVWVIPVVALAAALAALSATFARWRRTPTTTATDDDRAAVEQALAER